MQIQGIQATDKVRLKTCCYGKKFQKKKDFVALAGSDGTVLLKPLTPALREKFEQPRQSKVRVVEAQLSCVVPKIEPAPNGAVTILIRGVSTVIRQSGHHCIGMRKSAQLDCGPNTRDAIKPKRKYKSDFRRGRRVGHDSPVAKPVCWKAKRATRYK